MTKKPFYDVFLNDIWSFSLYKLFPISPSKFDHLTSETPPPDTQDLVINYESDIQDSHLAWQTNIEPPLNDTLHNERHYPCDAIIRPTVPTR